MRGMAGLLWLAWAVSCTAPAAAQSTLQVGVVPNVSPRMLLEQNRPLRQYLERRLARPVEIVTAPDFKSFHERVLAGAYDLAVSPAHMARLAQVDAGHPAIAVYAPGISCIMVTARDGGISSVEQLRGKSLTLANPLSLVALHGQQWLARSGLRAGADYEVKRVRADDSAANLLLRGESAAALMSGGELRAVPQPLRDRLTVLQSLGEVKAFIVLANRRLGPAERGALRAALLEFSGAPEFGEFSAATGFKGMDAIDEAELRALDALLPETRRMLAGG